MDAREKGMRAAMRHRRSVKSIEAIEENINDLLDERNKLNKSDVRVLLEQELSIERQARNVIMLRRALEDITQRKADIELEAGTLAVLTKEREELLAQSAEITGVEQELIDRLKVLTKEQAENGDITAIEAAEIENLHIEMRAAKRQMDAGIISQIQYQAAQQRVTEAVEEALLPSEKLLELTATINDMRRAEETLLHDLKIAENEHKLAIMSKDEAVADAITRGEAKAEIDEQLIEAGFQLAEATMEQAAAEVELAKTGPEVAAALEMMREQSVKLGLVAGNAFESIVDQIHNAMVAAQQAMPEFAFLKRLLEGIELAGLDADQIDAFVRSIEDALEGAEELLEGFDLIALIESLLPEGWRDTLEGWREDLQQAINTWNLEATIKLLLDDSVLDGIISGSGKAGGGGGATLTEADLIYGGGLPELSAIDSAANLATALEGGFASVAANELFTDIQNTTREQIEAGQTDAGNLALREQATADYFAANVGNATAAPALAAFLATLAPSAASGGIVKRDTLANVHAGEAIIPLKGGGGMGATYNINVGAGISDPTAVSEAVVEALRAYERGNGPIPVTTTASMYTASS
jgi:hypothetical protein